MCMPPSSLDDRVALDKALLAAHAGNDRAALVEFYAEAGDDASVAGRLDAACFYWTHAYVFALQSGDPAADRLHARLKAHGRED